MGKLQFRIPFINDKMFFRGGERFSLLLKFSPLVLHFKNKSKQRNIFILEKKSLFKKSLNCNMYAQEY